MCDKLHRDGQVNHFRTDDISVFSLTLTHTFRVTGVPLTYLLSGGQQKKVISQLLRKVSDTHMHLENKL